ncbi:kinase-like protein [Cadophora sp. DSE1049]|nr:kinase-like protein [Cadophora sp. DSE1049]
MYGCLYAWRLSPACLEDILNQRYTIVHKLGNGGFAVVWLAWDERDTRWVSLKIVQAGQAGKCKELDFLRYLAQLGIDLEDNFICPLLDDFQIQGPNGCHVCMVFPFAGSSVFDEIDNTMPATRQERVEIARQYGRQLAHAVTLLHSVGIVHGDITAANVLTQISFRQSSLDELYEYTGVPERVVDRRWRTSPGCEYLVSAASLSGLPTNGRILLIDFSEAFWIGHPPARGLGIPITSATPECLYSGAASPSSDIWAIACLLFRWWSGQHLFKARTGMRCRGSGS